MQKVVIFLVAGLSLLTSHAQSGLTAKQVDSIAARIDANNLFETYKIVDSSNFSTQTRKMTVYNYKKEMNGGQIEKIERVGNGTCDNKEQYYFVNGRLLKAVIEMRCDGKLTWDSEFYYFNDIAFSQTDKGNTLNGSAFKQTAYEDLKKILKLEKENR